MTILRPYIYRHTPYRPPPLYQGLGSRVLQGHRVTRVTGHHGSQGHHGHGSYRVTGSLGYRVYYPRFLHCPYLQGHHGLGSRVTMGYHHPNHRVTGHRVTGSRVTGSQGYRVTGHHGLRSRVTHHPGDRISHHPGYRVIITMVSGHI